MDLCNRCNPNQEIKGAIQLTIPFKKTIALLAAFVWLLTAMQIVPASAADGDPAVPDGEYSVPYRYVKDGTTQTSAANAFMVPNSGKLIVENGEAKFEHEVAKTDYTTFAYFGSRMEGENKATIVNEGGVETAVGIEGYYPAAVRDSANPDNVVLQLVVDDVWTKQDILMHIHDTENMYGLPVIYNHWYNAQLELNLTGIDLTPPVDDDDNNGDPDEQIDVTIELFDERAAAGYDLLASTVEGEYEGAYPAGSQAELSGKIELAEAIVGGAPGNAPLLAAAYTIVDEAIKKYESLRVVVNKANLTQWLAVATAWAATAKDAGETEKGVPTRNVPLGDGEYPLKVSNPTLTLGLAQDVRAKIAEAQTLLADPLATQAQVDALYNLVYFEYDWEDIEKQKFVASTVNILVLDSIGDDAQISPYAPYIGPTAVVLQKAAHPYYEGYAHITFTLDPEIPEDGPEDAAIQTLLAGLLPSDVRGPTLSASIGLFLSGFGTAAPLVTAKTNADQKVYQIFVRSNNSTNLQTDMLWQGIGALQFPNSVTPASARTVVYISFNKDLLDHLNALADEARELHDAAVVGTELGQYPASYKAQLQTAIDQAGEIGSKLAAPRPQILTATAALQSAMDELQAAQARTVHFSAVHATQDAFSAMESYFEKPALVATADDGSLHATVTIKNSAAVPEFRVRHDGEFVDATVVGEDAAANTRVVTFPVDGLSALLDAQVRTVVPAQDYDQTHDIRLHFNNVDNRSLYQLIQTATAAQQAAVEGTQPGQYPPLAKTLLQANIDAAHQEAVRLDAEAADTATAQLLLQQALNTFNVSYIAGGSAPPPPPPSETPGTVSNPVYPADGYYYISFRVLKDGTNNTSMMQSYVVSPALLRVSGNTKTVSFTVLQSAEITGLTLNGSSGTVSGANSAANTRVVAFTLSDLSSIVAGWVNVEWAQFDYFHSYDIQFQFNEASISFAGHTNPGVPGSNGNVGPPPGYEEGVAPGGTPEDELLEEETLEDEAREGEIPGSEAPESEAQEGGSPPSSGNSSVRFSDTELHWAASSIDKAIGLGIVNGYADGSFRPNAQVTRGEFVVMISRALKLGGNADGTALRDFDSVPGWAQEHVARAVAAGLIGGYADQTFRPGDQLTRAQLAVIIARAAGLELEEGAAPDFADAADIPAWAQREVAAAVKAGLIKGKDGNVFDPNQPATRAEALTLIIRLLEATAAT